MALALLAGCATPLQIDAPDATAGLPRRVELEAVPFFPQQRYHCGPAALATVLGFSGVETTPEALVDAVYLPRRKGSLQLELVATARRHGRVPYPLAPRITDLLTEVAGGRPVLVLQNLGLDWAPRWHYAVVVGFDLDTGEIVLRSGSERRHRLALRLFELTWARGGRWALVVLAPGELGVTTTPRAYIEAVAPLARDTDPHALRRAYAAVIARWPRHAFGWLGLGNTRVALDDQEGAIAAYTKAIELDPDLAAAHNNLAHVLLRQGQRQRARPHAERAVALDPSVAAYRKTLGEAFEPE